MTCHEHNEDQEWKLAIWAIDSLYLCTGLIRLWHNLIVFINHELSLPSYGKGASMERCFDFPVQQGPCAQFEVFATSKKKAPLRVERKRDSDAAERSSLQ